VEDRRRRARQVRDDVVPGGRELGLVEQDLRGIGLAGAPPRRWDRRRLATSGRLGKGLRRAAKRQRLLTEQGDGDEIRDADALGWLGGG
jgi:hypothetical protein